MADEERDKVAEVFRQHASRIEATAFDQSSRLNEEIITELVEIAARFSEVADMLESGVEPKTLRPSRSTEANRNNSEKNGVDHES